MAQHIAVIGGGAAGLTAAVALAQGGKTVTVWEKAPRVGRKLIATGNGTCNITNRDLALSHYHGADPAFALSALEAFTDRDTVAFFGSIGVDCVTDPDGRVYPRSRQAGSVLDCLRLALQAAGGTVVTGRTVGAIHPQKGGFSLAVGDERATADAVIVAVGGAAAPSLGGGVDGYALLTALGHTRTPLFASIVQLRTDTAFVKAIKGIRVDAAVTLEGNGQTATARGEVLFTEYGLSGPAVMAISRLAGDWERRKRGDMTARLDLLPDLSKEDLTAILRRRRALPGRDGGSFLTGFLNTRVGQTAVRMAGLSLSAPAGGLTDGDLKRIAGAIKNWRLPVTGTQGFSGAQVTAGGIATADFDPRTMRSRLVPGVYAVGEVLDIDGDCGGYNLQWAFSSAMAAARDLLK
ncbi:MAG: aminoacetone oxidase family FAD-binding enzyme [Acutalibacteraceae bacterium]|jgi:predicted Rossmann fold flavoprotein